MRMFTLALDPSIKVIKDCLPNDLADCLVLLLLSFSVVDADRLPLLISFALFMHFAVMVVEKLFAFMMIAKPLGLRKVTLASQ